MKNAPELIKGSRAFIIWQTLCGGKAERGLHLSEFYSNILDSFT